MTDEQIVFQVITKNQNDYRQIVDRYQTKLMRYASYLVQNNAKAADVVQETFIKAFVNLKGFNPKYKFSSWLYRIAHNESMNALKKYHHESPMLPDVDFASEENLEADYSQKEIIQMANICLKNLPSEYSEPLSLYYLENLSYQEISDILRLPTSTVGTRIKRAKLLMRSLCQKNP